MKTKKFITISGGKGRSKLYALSPTTQRAFKKLYPNFEALKGDSDEWELALNWIEENATLLSDVDCFCY